MEDYTLPLWIYLAVLTVLIGGAVQKVTVVTWLGATVLVEKLSVPVLLLVLICIWMCCRRNQTTERLSALGKAVLITGCDSGFGHAAARTLDELGFQVFATVMDLEGSGAKELRRNGSPRLHLLQLDITQPQQVQQVLLETSNRLGLRGLWGLVNNAGVCVNFGDAELSLMSNYRGCMEVNFFGTMSVTQAFLPLLRKGKGRIVTVSSPAGDQPFPLLSAYGASKAALNLFINTLRHELLPWGVNVSTILPSSYKTGQSSNEAYWDNQYKQLIQSLPPSLVEEYGEDYMNETRELFRSHARSANEDLSPVIITIVEALLAPRPLARYYAGPGVGLMYFIHTYLPTAVSDKFLQKLFVQKKLLPRILRKENDLDVIHSISNNNNEDKLAM